MLVKICVQDNFFLNFNHLIGSTVRLVNRRFKCIAENSLNTSFKQIEQKLKTLKEKIGLLLYTANEESQIKKYSKSLSIVEVLQFHVFKQTTQQINCFNLYLFIFSIDTYLVRCIAMFLTNFTKCQIQVAFTLA